MSLLTRRRVIAAKIETVEGTAEVLTVTDGGILALDPKFDPNIKMNNRENVLLPTLSQLQPIPGARDAKMTFKVELKGAGAAYSSTVTPALGKYLRACGFLETVVTAVGTESVSYKPASTGIPSLTIWMYLDGVAKKIRGARGTVKYTGKAGEPCYAEFDFQGVYDDVVDAAMIMPAFEATVPPVFLNASVTLAAYAAVISSFTVDMANTLALRDDPSKAEGYSSCMITDRKPTGKLDPEFAKVADHDFYGLWKAGTPLALTIGAIGSVQYNRFMITAPKVVTSKIGESDRNALSIADSDFVLALNTGDDEVVLTFT
jgi:hypothetical protein